MNVERLGDPLERQETDLAFRALDPGDVLLAQFGVSRQVILTPAALLRLRD